MVQGNEVILIIISCGWGELEEKRPGPAFPAAQAKPTTERNEVNECT
jgi:hypothetical protein